MYTVYKLVTRILNLNSPWYVCTGLVISVASLNNLCTGLMLLMEVLHKPNESNQIYLATKTLGSKNSQHITNYPPYYGPYIKFV